jgi:hypothetical protein
MFGKKLHLPDANDVSKVFAAYSDDARRRSQAGKLKQGEDVSITGDQIRVEGAVAVMAINGLLVKLILDYNPDHRFFMEESMAIDDLYPYLVPHGLIMELLHTSPPRFSEALADKDSEYWKKIAGEVIGDWVNEKTSIMELCDFVEKLYHRKDLKGFKGDADFANNLAARKGFSKLRDSLGGLYAWRADQPGENKQLMHRHAELAFKQAFAFCPANEVVDRYLKLLTKLNRTDEAILLVKAALRIDPENGAFNKLLQSLQSKAH